MAKKATKKPAAKKTPAKKSTNKAAAKKNAVVSGDERVRKSIEIGLKLAKKNGLSAVSVSAVAAEQNVTAPLIFRYVGNREELHKRIKAAAKKAGISLLEAVAKKTPVRKRSIKEVKAIKNKVPVVKKAPARAGSHAVSQGKKPAAKKSSASAGRGAQTATSSKKAPVKKPKFPTLPPPPAAADVVVPQAPTPTV